MSEPRLLWSPSATWRDDATLTAFTRFAAERHELTFSSYDDLWRWSVDEVETFWEDVWVYFGVRASRSYDHVLSSREMPGARWFEGAELNYAESMLSGRDRSSVAVVHASETRPLASVTWGELADDVARLAAGLRELGVGRGDRVAAVLPNIPETIVALLATVSLGAIWTSAAPEFGVQSLVDRFAQIEPKVLFVIDGYVYGGREFRRAAAMQGLLEELPTVEHTVLLPYLDPRSSPGAFRGGVAFDDLAPIGGSAALAFEHVPFEHPLWILFSSGTTGLPKAIVHGHGGILLEQLKFSHLHLNLKADDRIFWFSTTGWMMWNLLVGCLVTDAAIVLYDGSPAHPDLGVLWRLAKESDMTYFGTSAGFLTTCMNEGIEPGRDYDLKRLRGVGSTGSPLPPEGFSWVYEHVKGDLWLFSTSGGTDVCTPFVGGCPTLPVYEGELQTRALGCSVEAWNERGESVLDEVGELVVTQPLPSMPVFFWGDSDGTRYRESYFEMYPGTWRHGDWIRITPRGGAVIYGRSDSTINRQGVRMGTSEIYRAVSAVPEVTDALVVDVPRDDGLWMPLFVVLRDGVTLDSALTAEIKRRVRENCSPRHVPDDILQIAEVPRTLSGKVLEVPIKRILSGTPVEQAVSTDSLVNPGALDYFVALALKLLPKQGA